MEVVVCSISLPVGTEDWCTSNSSSRILWCRVSVLLQVIEDKIPNLESRLLQRSRLEQAAVAVIITSGDWFRGAKNGSHDVGVVHAN